MDKGAGRAHQLVYLAIRKGKLVRKPCEVCGADETHAHHDDYEKPLDVRWLCRKHHREAHGGVKPVAHRDFISWRSLRDDPEGIEEPVIVVKTVGGEQFVIGAWFPAWTLDELESSDRAVAG